MSNKVNVLTQEQEAARKAANEKRLASMRAGLARIESAADALLNKAGELTPAERLDLLRLVNVAYHDSGKIEGCNSIDSCAACEFCQRMIGAAADNVLIICGACYAAADAWKEAAWRRHKLNARILSSVLFTVEEFKLFGLGDICRYNEDGDTVNVTMARNYIRNAAAHPETRFGYWYKNAAAVSGGLAAEGYTRREQLPENIRFIHSSIYIGISARPLWFDDAVFTVYPDDTTTSAAIAAGAHECNGRRCRACGYTCYFMARRPQALMIAEYLRTNKANRAVILEALAAWKARRAC